MEKWENWSDLWTKWVFDWAFLSLILKPISKNNGLNIELLGPTYERVDLIYFIPELTL